MIGRSEPRTRRRPGVQARPIVKLFSTDENPTLPVHPVERDLLLDLAARAVGIARILEGAAANPDLLDPALRHALITATRKFAWRLWQAAA